MTADTITAADIRINARWLIPIEPADVVLEHQAVLVQGDRIAAIVSQDEADARFRAKEVIDLPSHVVLPGLINMHGHAAMSLFRGLADDLPLMTWLNDHIWPAEGAFVSEAFIADGTQLAMAEMLRTGTTTFSDMYFFPEIVAQLAHDAGMRAQICFPLLDFPTPWGSGPDEYLSKGEAFIKQWQDNAFIMPAIGPHAPYTVSDEPLRKAVALSEATGAPIQIHLHETAFEVADAMEKSGKRPTARLAELKVLGTNTQCVHMTQIDESDIALLQATGAHVIHCPESNLKLASGLSPVQTFRKAGVNVAIGTDGAASNNDLDLFGELNTAAMLAKVVADDASALSAHEALAMATIQGARALGRDHELGSLAAGKLADIIAVDLGDPFLQPVYDPASHLVYSNHGRQVSHSWINGVPQVQEGKLTRIDVPDLMLRVQGWADRIREQQTS
ncbi:MULTISPECIES: TRZ/ATZ family hydrolase [Marinobacter]|jgi:5-methylthioadenosine/S-adenosylhomocysteine deaminase|uniref:5-methylthioadenosine/S-adenosylhomocysteine deaminase n=1 Tax=Marinobacter salarius TaxID=1420917 RepID=A0ABY1FN27_9GAMM|nr:MULTISPECIES: TRZ/ATZ family hydrolase [Marinobacter]KXJ42205.1 MAG: N-ethylammeline chlorohydrolase [Marinobacter sp. Hex_13]MAB51831.1 N-ethylammeline chlorohydrolase [Marinobacter sp.]MBJ7276968.1 TRZ/ATZ family hydrolase [Marinobacter salarius]MDM8180928.1 TRZ/ATZ family hydrolase [Marinobacter salarius]OLF85357.1 N-ethylammeline chlorohydrolase [Marinobacter sp. C18]|tara:strand:+ start:652 stop:1992 length:1341 start_codon:yes stop_codon:yes gene_type:complete